MVLAFLGQVEQQQQVEPRVVVGFCFVLQRLSCVTIVWRVAGELRDFLKFFVGVQPSGEVGGGEAGG